MHGPIFKMYGAMPAMSQLNPQLSPSIFHFIVQCFRVKLKKNYNMLVQSNSRQPEKKKALSKDGQGPKCKNPNTPIS